MPHQRTGRGRSAAGHNPNGGCRTRPCPFCRRTAEQVKTLIAGPGVYICDRCIPVASQAITAGEPTGGADTAIAPVAAEAMTEKCSFCGKRRHQVPCLAAARGARICAECLELCDEILTERLA